MTCSFRACVRPVALIKRVGQYEIGTCAVHELWLRVLADERYRYEPCPVVTDLGIQGALKEVRG